MSKFVCGGGAKWGNNITYRENAASSVQFGQVGRWARAGVVVEMNDGR